MWNHFQVNFIFLQEAIIKILKILDEQFRLQVLNMITILLDTIKEVFNLFKQFKWYQILGMALQVMTVLSFVLNIFL